MTVLKYLYKDWFGVKRGHPDMPDLKAYVLDRDFNADYPTRTRPGVSPDGKGPDRAVQHRGAVGPSRREHLWRWTLTATRRCPNE